MLFVLVCTEGEVSEPACIKAFLTAMASQIPRSGDESVDIIPVPVKGNQGYKVLVQRAEQEIEALEKDPQSLLSIASESDLREKWLVCDYDELDDRMTYEEFKRLVLASGYTLVMNKPNFEYFILAVLAGWDVANSTKTSHIEEIINNHIDKLNESNKRNKNFPDSLKLPPYSKKHYMADELFGKLFSYNSELFFELESHGDDSQEKFSDMPILISRLRGLYKLN